MARTRTSKPTTSSQPSDEPTNPKPTIAPADSNPPKIFILPKNTSKDARIMTLPDPARNKPARYLYCPEKGFFEFVRVAAGKTAAPRSWLLVSATAEEKVKKQGYVSQSQDLFVATPFDALFFLLPIVCGSESVSAKDKDGKKALFKILDDYIDSAPATISTKFSPLLRYQRCRTLFEKRLRAVCDVVEAGDETMFRISQEKLTTELQSKAQRLVTKGLPVSLEDKFVTRALDMPVSGRAFASIKSRTSEVTGITWKSAITEIQDGSLHRLVEREEKTEPDQPLAEAVDEAGQKATDVLDDPNTEKLSAAPSSPPSHLIDLLRSKTALNFILRSYVAPHLHAAPLSSTAALDFTPLELHMTHLSEVRSQAQALRTISNNISRKRSADEDEPIDYEEVKKRKKEEEDKKKKMTSFGVKALSKVNTKGMKKMSSFFIKKDKT
jgi:hypothetical protein